MKKRNVFGLLVAGFLLGDLEASIRQAATIKGISWQEATKAVWRSSTRAYRK